MECRTLEIVFVGGGEARGGALAFVVGGLLGRVVDEGDEVLVVAVVAQRVVGVLVALALVGAGALARVECACCL